MTTAVSLRRPTRRPVDPDRGFGHLARLTDEVGLFEHAHRADPRPEHGWCVDDNARAVVVVERALDERPDLDQMFQRVLRFVLDAHTGAGRFHNRRGPFTSRWTDRPGTGEWWGRALWALGHVLGRRPDHPFADRAREVFAAGARQRSTHPRAMACAAFGAVEVLSGAPTPGEAALADALLADAVTVIGRPRPGAWRWPEARLTYANAALADALIAAGVVRRDAAALSDGLDLLDWLAEVETRNGVMSFTPVDGRNPGETGPAYDQQPIEAWAMTAAAVRALRATGDRRWAVLAERCAAWFAGANDAGVPLQHERSGGGCDGLTAGGRNDNQGAESTLAMLATHQLVAGVR